MVNRLIVNIRVYMTKTLSFPLSITYYSVGTRESVRLEFLIAGMNDLDICACHIRNAYLNNPCRGKLWTEAGATFGSEKKYVKS